MKADQHASEYVTEAVTKAAQVEGLPANVKTRPIRKVGILGAGTMGGGIAMNFANIGLPVTIVETAASALERGLATVRGNYERSASRGRFPVEEVALRMDRIAGSLDFGALADCDLVIEAVYEDMALKKSIFARLDQVAREGAILASNTSALDLDEIAAATDRPQDVIGLHFFSPANVMKLLEVVRGARTAPDVVATAMELATRIGKIAVLSGVCPGFIGNRMLYPRQVQAQALLAEGAMPWDVDRALKAFGFKMGPFEMADLAGLDIGWSEGARTADPLRDALCEMGRRGQKTRAGYYDYDEARAASPSPAVADLIRERNGSTGERVPSDDTIVARCLYPLVNEGAKILDEEIAQRASDIDVVWIYGYGWPAETGGPMRWADSVGLDQVKQMADKLRRQNEWYAPSPILTRLIAEGRTFTGS